jgi:hypothetical protein
LRDKRSKNTLVQWTSACCVCVQFYCRHTDEQLQNDRQNLLQRRGQETRRTRYSGNCSVRFAVMRGNRNNRYRIWSERNWK